MSTLDTDLIREYLIQVGCKVEYPILVNAFKKHLCNPDPIIQGNVRTQFKDSVNKLATVTVENNMKFITLRPEFRPVVEVPPQKPERPKRPPPLQQANSFSVRQRPPPLHQTDSFNVKRSPSLHQANSFNTKQPVPRLRQTNSFNHAKHPQPPTRQSTSPYTIKRRWAIEACSCNYNNVLALLREDPKLASCKDIANGYTAIHWAAKFGNIEIIRLVAGNYAVPVDIKSSAGHTPLHVAYMFNRVDVVNLLLDSYRANPEIRDHSGKKPMQYWQKPS